MPIKEMPQFKSVPDKMLEIPQPAVGGLDLKDLEYEQEVSKSPYMKNIMYRNGAFGKRFGQEVHSTYADTIYATVYYGGDIFVHSGGKIYKYNSSGTHTQIATGLPEKSGVFIVYAQTLYYIISDDTSVTPTVPGGFFQYKNNVWGAVSPYVPDVFINCKPDGTHSDAVDDFNVIGSQFNLTYNGEAGVTVYQVGPYDPENVIDWDTTPTITVNETETTAFTVDKTNKKITFSTAPGEGSMNVVMTFTMKTTIFENERAQIFGCKFYDTYGGANNSRLFLAGGGNSKYYYSDAYDITNFPESNFATLGNTEDDITGFGRQYNVLIVFKPREIYSIYSYTESSTTTVIEENIGKESFRSQLVNSRIGCDAPYSIQLVNNMLTWFNSNWGVCTLASTNIQDERNVRVISRNIEETNNFGITGLLNVDEDLTKIASADYNNKYFLVFPTLGRCFMWDYELQRYVVTSRGETDPKTLVWFYFDKFYAKSFLLVGKQLLYASSYSNVGDNVDFTTSLIKLNASFADLDFNGDGEPDPIESFYMTPFFQFGAVEMLKNVRYIYVQCRGDVNAKINLYYYTDDSMAPEEEPEPIMVQGGGSLWKNFAWEYFHWYMNIWGNVFVRKCNLKKIQMASFFFTNNELNRDMPITNIGLRYQLVKYVR